jgi:hypothetical protein
MNKAKSANHSQSLFVREMAAMGIPLDPSVVPVDVEIEQFGGMTDNMIFDLPDGRAGWSIGIRTTNRTTRPIEVCYIEPRPPWLNSEFELLPDPREVGNDPFNYHFPGGVWALPREQVINHLLLDRGILQPGCPG